jgi:NADH dehydrogenase
VKRGEIDLTIVNRTNSFLFTPLLHEVATGGLSPRSVAEPLREIFRGTDIRIIQGWVDSIDSGGRTIEIRTDGEAKIQLSYDVLVIATGAETNYYGIAGAQEYALPLKTLADAARIRNRIIDSFERAAEAADADERRRLMSFAIVGGGATGVEVAAELVEFTTQMAARYDYCKECTPRITLVSATNELLEQFKPSLRRSVLRQLEKKGVRVMLGTLVTEASARGLMTKSGEMVDAGTVIWSAGVKPAPPVFSDMKPTLAGGRLAVDSAFRLLGSDRIFAMGDVAAYVDAHAGVGGKPLPQLAQVAEAEAETVAMNVLATVRGGRMRDFHFHSKGAMVSVGEWFAIGEIYSMDIAGWFTWWLWRTVYLFKFASWKKRIRIGFEWLIALFFPRDITKIS